MNLRKSFIFLLALTLFQGHSFFVFDAVSLALSIAGLGIGIVGTILGIDGGKGTDLQLDNIKGKLNVMSSKMDFAVENNAQFSNWLNLRTTLRTRMNAIYRDIPRDLTDVECTAIANSVIGDDSDSIHQLIQRLHETLFDTSLSHGSVFKYVTDNIETLASNKNISSEILIFDFYLGVMSLETEAAIALKFQFDVFKHVNPNHNEDRRKIEKSNSIQRINTTKKKFKDYMKTARLHVKKTTYDEDGLLCVGELKADPGYIISDFKLEKAKHSIPAIPICSQLGCARNKVSRVHWHPKIQQSKLGPFGIADPATSSWKMIENYNNTRPLIGTQYYSSPDINPSNATHQYALTDIIFGDPKSDSPDIVKKRTRIAFDSGDLLKDDSTQIQNIYNEIKTTQPFAATLLFDFSISNLELELHKLDYSVFI